MKTLVVLLFCIIATVVGSEEKPDLDKILADDSAVKIYFDCIVDKGDCPPEGKELKEKIPESLEHGCKDCTQEEKDGIWKVIVYLVQNKPEFWKELQAKYDPNGKYKEKYSKKLEEKLAESKAKA